MKQGRYAKVKAAGIGLVWVAATPGGICRVTLGESRRAFLDELPGGMEWIEVSLLRFPGPVDLGAGTPFQQRVWRAIASIPRGETRSYAWLARKAGKPTACRAAANACGANPVPLLVPCHRVIASDGSLGGFSLGLALKRKLLRLEGHRF